MGSRRRRYTPRLTAEIVEDDDVLAEITGDVLVQDAGLRALSHQIVLAQEVVQEEVGDDAWAAYLDLESLVNERAEQASLLLARWAFKEGRMRRRWTTGRDAACRRSGVRSRSGGGRPG